MDHPEDLQNTAAIHQPVQKSVHELQLLCTDGEWHIQLLEIDIGMRQGCILSPFLFLLTEDFSMKKVMENQNCGIRWKGGAHLMDLNFADDITLLANTSADLQSMTTKLEGEACKIWLRLNSEQTKVMITGEATVFPPIIIGQQTTEYVKNFTYLGSMVDNSGKLEPDVNSRIGKVSFMF